MYNYIKKPKKANKNNLYLSIERLSKIVTEQPFLINCLLRLVPINPAPPLIKTRFIKVDFYAKLIYKKKHEGVKK